MPNPAFTIPFSAKFQAWDLNSSADGNDVDDEIDQKVSNDNALEAAMQAANNGIPFTNFVEILTSQTFVIPANIYKIFIEVGGGGGGGGGNNSSGTDRASGGGGGAGEIRKGLFSVTPSANLVIAIGAGGAGGATGVNGSDGGQTVLTGAVAMTVSRGQGGISSLTIPTGGNIAFTGSGGIRAQAFQGSGGEVGQSTIAFIAGGGRGGGFNGGAGALNLNGRSAETAGGGQGGGIASVFTARTGGAGGSGYVRIWY